MVRPIAPTTDPRPPVPATRAVCPYLMAADGAWRASTPARDHRCTAVTPVAILAPEKQRRLCLVDEHLGCATYRAAARRFGDPNASDDLAVDGPTITTARPPARAIARTVPLVLDHGRVAVSVPVLRGERGFGQVALLAMMGLAFAAIVLARLSAGDGDGSRPGVVGAASPSPTTASSTEPAASAEPAVAATDVPVRTLVPTEVQPTPPAVSPGASAAPSGSGATYKVKSGDTLSGIAAEFGTTWQTIAKLNAIDDPGRLKVGQVLELP